jgi:CheY-like chemotaxis protein
MSQLPRELVLVVEDDPAIRDLAVEFLRDERFDVTEAADGESPSVNFWISLTSY